MAVAASGSRSRGKSRRVEQLLPLGYLVVALALVLGLLPSVLRSQPPPANDSAELSPDSSKDHQQSIIASLNAAGSETAGSGQGQGGNGPGTGAGGAPPPPPPQPALGCHGFGDPPRQTESLYSAPCVPKCPSNEGATYKNVSAGEVKIGFRHGSAAPSYTGPIKRDPDPADSGVDRTARVIQAYFNQRFQTCGRYIQLVALEDCADPGKTATDQQACAAKFDTEQHLFGAYMLGNEFCNEFIRRGLLAMCNPEPERFYDSANGLRWGWMTDFTKIDNFTAELLCKQLQGKPATFTDDPALNGKPRKFGGLYWTSVNGGGSHTTDDVRKAMASKCGMSFTDFQEFPAENESNEIPNAQAALARFRAEGITTVVFAHETAAAAVVMADATSNQYFPEWVLPSPYGVDFNLIGSILPPEQMRHAFGFSQWELPHPSTASDCYIAYQSVDPTNTPDGTFCKLVFPFLQQFVNGIQMAGPRLNPQTFRDGLYKLGHRFYPDRLSVGGGFGPGDYTYIDDFGLIWWDRTAPDPETGNQGAYRWVMNGKRFQLGQIPTAPVGFFTDLGTVGSTGT